MMGKETSQAPLINQSEVEAVYLSILSRVRELTFGEHKSIFTGSGFDFSGLREWQPGDRQSSIDWAHSTHTGFSPLIVRECVEERSVDALIVADASPSVWCGLDGITVAQVIAQVIATIGFSAVIFQDRVGLTVFGGSNDFFVEPSKGGKKQVLNVLELYQNARSSLEVSEKENLVEVVSGVLRRTSLVVVVSDFLFPKVEDVIKELASLQNVHDVFLAMVDASFVFNLPKVSFGWIECVDVETGHKMLLSNREWLAMPKKVRQHQDKIRNFAEKEGLETLIVGPEKNQFRNSIVDFFLERRFRRK